MADRTSATPLLALDAVALDTETTSLDPRAAHILEIGAIRLVSGRVRQDDSRRVLVNPGIAIPPDSTSVHGIDDAKVRDAPSFAKAWPEISGFIGGSFFGS